MGTGEVTRYLAVHGPGRVKAAVLVAPLLPFLLKTHDNPDGIDQSVFDGLTARIAVDRPAAMKDFIDRSYNIDLLGGDRVSDQAWQNSFYVAISASAHAAVGGVTACLEDFRGDLATISSPVLVRSLTAISQTGRTAPDSGVRDGHPADPDLRLRTLAHWPDTWH